MRYLFPFKCGVMIFAALFTEPEGQTPKVPLKRSPADTPLAVKVEPPDGLYTVTLTPQQPAEASERPIWFMSPRKGTVTIKRDNSVWIVKVPPGVYEGQYTTYRDGVQVDSYFDFTTGTKPPDPPPQPPGPGPTPPTPTPPDIKTGMIELPGFHVLIKYRAFPDGTRTADEESIVFSESDASVRQYLKKACPPVDGQLGFRFYPVEAVGAAEPWLTPWKRGAGDLPIATISKNGKGWEGSIKGWTPEKFIAKCKEIEALP